MSGSFLPPGFDGRLWWLTWLVLAWTDACKMVNQHSLKVFIIVFAQWPNLTSWRTKQAIHGPLKAPCMLTCPKGWMIFLISEIRGPSEESPLRFRRWGASSSYYFIFNICDYTLPISWLCESKIIKKRKNTEKNRSIACLVQSWMPRIPRFLIQMWI